MKLHAMVALFLVMVVPPHGSHAETVDEFVDALNTAWVASNYPSCWSSITNRLTLNSNDVPALVAQACYHVFVDADFSAATNVFVVSDPLVLSLTGTNVASIAYMYNNLRADIIASLSIPMTNPAPEADKRYVRDNLYPTNYPEQVLLRLLGDP